MRIISGIRRGMTLLDFDHSGVRPTSDKVKGSVFNMLMNLTDMSRCRVLDLFSGTGNLGIEALSRGAIEAVFVELDNKVTELLTQNLHKAGFMNHARIVQQDARFFISSPATEPFDVVLADPPYELRLGDFVIENVLRNKYLAPGGLIIYESSVKERFDPAIYESALTVIRERNFRETLVTIFKNNV